MKEVEVRQKAFKEFMEGAEARQKEVNDLLARPADFMKEVEARQKALKDFLEMKGL